MRLALLFTSLIAVLNLTAQVTFSEHIAPIIYDNCTSCHRAGEIAPFELTSYPEVAAWGNMLKYVTEIRYMPPWKPNMSYSKFVGEKGLTDDEINLIAEWVDLGMPQGDSSLEPPLPEFPSGSQLGTPDLVLEMSEEHYIEGNNKDDYRVFVLPTGLTEDKEIAAVEFRPGNTSAVHHALLAFETEGLAAEMDASTPEYGYESFGDFGVTTQGTFTGYTPGILTVKYPQGIGKVLQAGSDLLLQVHYAPLPSDETDRSSVNIFFKKDNDPIQREVERLAFTPLNLDGGWFSFRIPPNEVTSFHGSRTVFQDVSLISVYPHSHYLGKSYEIYAETSDGEIINIIKIDDWDFNWQGAYTFDRMKKIPAGSTVHVNAVFDNTVDNPFNPSNPPQLVTWGESTTDEMYLVSISHVPYQEGDENIVIGDESSATDNSVTDPEMQIVSIYPNPTSHLINVDYRLDKASEISVELWNADGRKVKTILSSTKLQAGMHNLSFNVSDYEMGLYSLCIRNEAHFTTRKVIVLESK